MNKLDLAGTLQAYAMRLTSCSDDKEKIISIIKRLKEELNIKEIRKELKSTNEQTRKKVG